MAQTVTGNVKPEPVRVSDTKVKGNVKLGPGRVSGTKGKGRLGLD